MVNLPTFTWIYSIGRCIAWAEKTFEEQEVYGFGEVQWAFMSWMLEHYCGFVLSIKKIQIQPGNLFLEVWSKDLESKIVGVSRGSSNAEIQNLQIYSW